jgi:hypothetical protein
MKTRLASRALKMRNYTIPRSILIAAVSLLSIALVVSMFLNHRLSEKARQLREQVRVAYPVPGLRGRPPNPRWLSYIVPQSPSSSVVSVRFTREALSSDPTLPDRVKGAIESMRANGSGYMTAAIVRSRYDPPSAFEEPKGTR